MSSSNSSSSMGNKSSDFDEIDEETIADSFVCCVCLDLLYKPIVLGCGHVSCFWCVHKSMDGVRESHCPICRNPYHHFPTICEMLHFLLLKMYPVAYKRREKQVLEEEKQKDCFSPDLDVKQNVVGELRVSQDANNTLCSMPPAPRHAGEHEDSLKVGCNGSSDIEENSSSATNCGGICSDCSIIDVLCPACSQVLFRPAVLNCGHVYCEACIILPEDGIFICEVCEIPHPTDFPKVCLELNNFLEEKFPEEYAARRQIQTRLQHKKSEACSRPNESTKKGFLKSWETTGEDFFPWWRKHGSKLHIGIGCDYCGMYPILGDRYRCKDCVELVGFDLCGNCYNTTSKRPGRFNQQHTPDHQFELFKQKNALLNMMCRIVRERRLLDSTGATALDISAIADSVDSRIPVESEVAVATSEHNYSNSNSRDFSTPMESASNELEISGHNLAASEAHSDEHPEQNGNNPRSSV